MTSSSKLLTVYGLLINSKDRVNTSPCAAAKYFIGNKYSNVRRVKLQNFSITNTFYNIKSPNNTFSINDGVNSIITFPIGTYNISSFSSVLQTLLNTSGLLGIYSVSINPSNLLLTITSTLPFSITWSQLDPNFPGLYFNMGFGEFLPSPTLSSLSLTSPSPVSLINCNKIGILISNCNWPVPISPSRGPLVTFIVDVPDNFGSQSIFFPTNDVDNIICSPPGSVMTVGGYIDIYLYDMSTGYLLDNVSSYQIQFSILC